MNKWHDTHSEHITTEKNHLEVGRCTWQGRILGKHDSSFEVSDQSPDLCTRARHTYTGTELVGGCNAGLHCREGLLGSAPSTEVCRGEGKRTGPRCCHCQARAGPVWPCRVGPIRSRAWGLYSQHQPVTGLAVPGKGMCPCAQLFAAKALTSKAPSHWGDGTRRLAWGAWHAVHTAGLLNCQPRCTDTPGRPRQGAAGLPGGNF